jgi:MFS family permease
VNSGAPTTLSGRQLWGLAIAAALVPLNSTMIAVALPDVAGDFDIATGSAGSLVTIYLVVMLVGQPTMGRVIDLVGGRRALHVSLVGFAAASIATSFATMFPLVVLGRAVQAVFGAALMPSAQALMRSLTEPERRGRSFGLLGSFIGVGAAAGPVIGGVLTELGGWRGIFLINAPIAAAALLATRDLPSPRPTPRDQTDGASSVWRVLRQRTFGAAFVTQATTTLAQYSLLLVVPIVLDARGWSSTEIGASLTTLTAGMVLMGPVGGRVGDLAGRRRPVAIGIGLAAVSTLVAAATVEDSSIGLVVAMAVFGFGLGFAVPSIQTAALESVPEQFAGSASGVLSMSRYTGSIPASILLGVMVSDSGAGSRNYLGLASIVMALAVLAATRMPGATDQTVDSGGVRSVASSRDDRAQAAPLTRRPGRG